MTQNISGFNPEIVNDNFGHAIVDVIKRLKPKIIVEIGSANGLGSTQAILKGIGQGQYEDVELHCVEIVPERFSDLQKNIQSTAGVTCFCHNGTAVPESGYMSEDRVRAMMGYSVLKTRQFTLELVLSWMKREKELVRRSAIVQLPRKADMVLIDGSAFTASAEFELFDDPSIIALDDTMDIKNYDNYVLLKNNRQYIMGREDPNLRNGFAIFEKIGE